MKYIKIQFQSIQVPADTVESCGLDLKKDVNHLKTV